MGRQLSINDEGEEERDSDSEEWVTIYPTTTPQEAASFGGRSVEIPEVTPSVTERCTTWFDGFLAGIFYKMLRALGHPLASDTVKES